jgi:predicted lysophospholipase L1 biosynthesis ABC-type transport system permease subunit
VVLAVAGVYNTMSNTVAQHTRGVAIHVALGAQGCDVSKLVIGEGMKLIAVGIAIAIVKRKSTTSPARSPLSTFPTCKFANLEPLIEGLSGRLKA